MDVKATPVRVFVADRRALVRESLCALLAACDDIELVGETSSLSDVENDVRTRCPDVVLMEVDMALASGAGLIHRILSATAGVRVLLLGERDDRERVLRGLQAGAYGYIPTRAAASELVTAIRAVRRGDYFLYPSAAKTVVAEYLRVGRNTSPDPYDQLSRRERAILQLISHGNTSRQIAESLSIAPRTVLAHRANIMAKLDAHNQTELLRVAIRKHLTTVE